MKIQERKDSRIRKYSWNFGIPKASLSENRCRILADGCRQGRIIAECSPTVADKARIVAECSPAVAGKEESSLNAPRRLPTRKNHRRMLPDGCRHEIYIKAHEINNIS